MSVDINEILERHAERWRHVALDNGAVAVRGVINELRERLETGYLGELYRTDYVVEGSGEFPFDMLRYACSWPKGESDSFAMGADHDEKRRVTLSKYHRDPQPVLSEDRWLSKFRWRVVQVIETVKT